MLGSSNIASGVRFIEPETTTTDAMLIQSEPMTLTSMHFNPKRSKKMMNRNHAGSNRRSILKNHNADHNSNGEGSLKSTFFVESNF